METEKICPVWLGYTFLIPLRKFQHDPLKILGPYIKKGMTVMDYGCAMGYFSIPMTKMVSPGGTVYCVDIQKKMLEKLKKRAARYNVSGTIKALQAGKDFNPGDLAGKLDFVLLFAVVHEVPDQKQLFTDLYTVLRRGGKVLFSEPKGHVKVTDYERSLKLAEEAGFAVTGEKPVRNGISMVLVKEQASG